MARCAWFVCRLGLLQIPGASSRFIRAHGVVVSHPLCMRKALGSIPSVSICFSGVGGAGRCSSICHCPRLRRFGGVVYGAGSRRQSARARVRTPQLSLYSAGLAVLVARFSEPMGHVDRAHGVVVSHPHSMREALGSIPSVSTFCHRSCLLIALQRCRARGRHSVCK